MLTRSLRTAAALALCSLGVVGTACNAELACEKGLTVHVDPVTVNDAEKTSTVARATVKLDGRPIEGIRVSFSADAPEWSRVRSVSLGIKSDADGVVEYQPERIDYSMALKGATRLLAGHNPAIGDEPAYCQAEAEAPIEHIGASPASE